MARTTATDVKAIVDTSLSDAEVGVFITSASLMVDQKVTDNSDFSELGSSVLEEIEKWLSAHLISITKERQAQSRKIGDASETYGKLGMGLNATTYGTMVLSLDTSGAFGSSGLKRATLEAVPSFDDSPVLD